MHASRLSATLFMLSASTGGLCLRSQPIICFKITHRRFCIKKCASRSPAAASMSMLSRLAKCLVDAEEDKQEHMVASTSSGEVTSWFYTPVESDVQYFADFAEVYRTFFTTCAKPRERCSQSTRKPFSLRSNGLLQPPHVQSNTPPKSVPPSVQMLQRLLLARIQDIPGHLSGHESIERVTQDRPPVPPTPFRLHSSNPYRTSAPADLLSLDPLIIHDLGLLEAIIAHTASPNQAWDAFTRCRSLSHSPTPELLARLSALLVSTRPRSRTVFLRLQQVLTAIRDTGGALYAWQWNALLHAAGDAQRRVRARDYLASVRVFREWREYAGELEEVQHHGLAASSHHDESASGRGVPIPEPTIRTYTTLLAIATRTRLPRLVAHALQLMRESSLEQDRMARLAILPFYIHRRRFEPVRAIIREFAEAGEDVGVDGVTAYIWALGRMGYVNEMEEVYAVLKVNVSCTQGGQGTQEQGEEGGAKLLFGDLLVFPKVVPNAVTYVSVVQILTFRGHLRRALEVYRDMLAHWQVLQDAEPELEPLPTHAIFRAIFLGFVRHARSPASVSPTLALEAQGHPEEDLDPVDWNLSTLSTLFSNFCTLTEDPPSGRIVHWILRSFMKTSDGDVEAMKTVWRTLEMTFGRLAVPRGYSQIVVHARREAEVAQRAARQVENGSGDLVA